ncbi:hypothetical protein VTO73DRAFT_7685 [Trametes versicolor]
MRLLRRVFHRLSVPLSTSCLLTITKPLDESHSHGISLTSSGRFGLVIMDVIMDTLTTEASAADGLQETQVLRADGWHYPYYGLSPVASIATPQDKPNGEALWPLLKRKQELENELRSVHALLNAGVPINTLPVELLAEVFKATQPKLGRESGERPWLAYLLICRHWFTVGATTPRLWDFPYATSSLNYARTCLARSKGVKIDVVVVPDVPVAPVLPHSMPALELFTVGVGKTTTDPRDEVMELTPERFPKLVHLSLSGLYLVPTAALRNLKVLHIDNLLGLVPGITMGMLTDLLQELACVEELRVHSVSCRQGLDPSRPMRTPRAALRSLKGLSMQDWPWGMELTKHILSVISVPPSSTIMIRGCIDDGARAIRAMGNPQGSGGWILPADRTGLPILSRGTEAFVDSTGTSERHTIDLASAYPLPSPYLTAICRDAPIVTLRIEMSAFTYCPNTTWRNALAPFSKLRELAVFGHGNGPSASNLFAGLNPDCAPADTPAAARVVLPELRTLRIEGFTVLDEYLFATAMVCLQKRRAALGLSKPLETLSFQLGDEDRPEFNLQLRTLYTEELSVYADVFSLEGYTRQGH